MKFNKKNIPFAIAIAIVCMVIMPVIYTFLSPSVSEAVFSHLGECDITYKDVFYPCITWREALLINFRFGAAFGIVAAVGVCFINPDEKKI